MDEFESRAALIKSLTDLVEQLTEISRKTKKRLCRLENRVAIAESQLDDLIATADNQSVDSEAAENTFYDLDGNCYRGRAP